MGFQKIRFTWTVGMTSAFRIDIFSSSTWRDFRSPLAPPFPFLPSPLCFGTAGGGSFPLPLPLTAPLSCADAPRRSPLCPSLISIFAISAGLEAASACDPSVQGLEGSELACLAVSASCKVASLGLMSAVRCAAVEDAEGSTNAYSSLTGSAPFVTFVVRLSGMELEREGTWLSMHALTVRPPGSRGETLRPSRPNLLPGSSCARRTMRPARPLLALGNAEVRCSPSCPS
mmetsp:Transcript_27093/g.64488  ORF Transcript_27093/g.64488 Transcript_27093/m.64488 type:complete len:230 (+) Transcript_27093:1774-2463(+)